jgi:hypothetical protein
MAYIRFIKVSIIEIIENHMINHRITLAGLGALALAPAALAASTVASHIQGTSIQVAPTQATTSPPAAAPAGLRDFDFFVGDWKVHHRQLKERLAGSHEWVEFDGTTSTRKIMGGWGNMDDNFLNKPSGGYRAVTLRYFDPATGQWSIWWLDGRTPSANLDPSIKGRFEHGVGTFYADDTLNGRPIRVRFTWSHSSAAACHWEQAFSPDGGKTWETNWTMDFRRV